MICSLGFENIFSTAGCGKQCARQSEGLEKERGVHSQTQSLRTPELRVFIKTQKQ